MQFKLNFHCHLNFVQKICAQKSTNGKQKQVITVQTSVEVKLCQGQYNNLT